MCCPCRDSRGNLLPWLSPHLEQCFPRSRQRRPSPVSSTCAIEGASMTTADYLQEFRIVTYPCRVHCGHDALAKLPAGAARHGASRVFVVCSRNVSTKTDLIDRIRALLGDTFAGLFDPMGKDSPVEDVLEAADQAREARADLLIAVGAGSVIQAVRVIAIALAEKAPLVELATQYPEDGSPAISPKLMAPKLPI